MEREDSNSEKYTFGFVAFRKQFGIATEVEDGELEEIIDLYSEMFETLKTEYNSASADEYFKVAQKSKEARLRRMVDSESIAKRQKVAENTQDASSQPKSSKKPDVIKITESFNDGGFKGEKYIEIAPSIIGQEDDELSHLPSSRECWKDDKKQIKGLLKDFAGGIHGVPQMRPKYETNDELLFKLMKKCLEHLKEHQFPTNPDFLYYALYRMFPSHGNQEKFADKFGDLCRKFGEKDLLVKQLEPWKTFEPEIEGDGTIECIDCRLTLCPNHGAVFQAPAVFETGNYFEVVVPILAQVDSAKTVCSFGPCWKDKPFSDVDKVLHTTEQERNEGKVTAYLSKQALFSCEPTDELMMLTFFESKPEEMSFCEWIEEFKNGDILSCQKAYEYVVNNLLFPDSASRTIGVVNELPSYKDRLSGWVSAQRRRQKRNAQNDEGNDFIPDIEQSKSSCMNFRLVEPMRPCLHAGPCGEAEDCVCRNNGTCSPLCKCPPGCPQRFPGCDCIPGKCRTDACQCWLAKFECSPTTCLRCVCDTSVTEGQAKCGNFDMTRGVYPAVHRGDSLIPNAGNGLFIEEDVKKHTLVIEYIGEKLSDDEIERRGVINDEHKCSYIFNLRTGGGIDSKNFGNLSRFANHNDKNPNMFARDVFVCGENRIGFYASRDISAGEELTFDYCYSEELKNKFFGSGSKKSKKDDD